MFGIGIPELVLIAIVALIVVGPARLPTTLRSIGRALGEFRRVSTDLRAEVGFDNVVEEVSRPLREGMAEMISDVRRDDVADAASAEYPESGADDYGALPETASAYPPPVYRPGEARAIEDQASRSESDDHDA